MRRTLSFVFLLSVLLNAQAKRPLAEPALSPDGKEIAFVAGGDIWRVDAKGGDATLLISHPDADARPMYSPDGKWLAFLSQRAGNGMDIYLLDLANGQLRRVTWAASAMLNAWSADSKWIYFHSNSADISAHNDVLRVPVNGGTPMGVLEARYMTEYFAAPTPDGSRLAFLSGGVMAASQWWRNGHSHIDENEIWLATITKAANEKPVYEKLVSRGAKHLWPIWAPDGKRLFYISDESGKENLHVWQDGRTRAISRFTTGRLLWPSLSGKGNQLCFERGFGIWMMDTSSGKAEELSIRLRGAGPSPVAGVNRGPSSGGEYHISPDGRKIAFVAAGDIHAASAKDGGQAITITRTKEAERNPVWSSDSKKLYYASRRPNGGIFAWDFAAGKEELLHANTNEVYGLTLSPNGKQLAWMTEGKELHALTLETKQDQLVAQGVFVRPPFTEQFVAAWSPDSEWLAWAGSTTGGFRNVFVRRLKDEKTEQISFLPNTLSSAPLWRGDGKAIVFLTGQRTEDTRVAMLMLNPDTPAYEEEKFDELFREAPKEKADAAKKATSVTSSNIRRRLRYLPLSVDVSDHALTPDGKTMVLLGRVAGKSQVFSYSLDELAKDRELKQLTTSSGLKYRLQMASDGKEVWYDEAGKLTALTLEGGKTRSITVTTQKPSDFEADKLRVFEEAWFRQKQWFYDEKMHGANWDKVREDLLPFALGAANTPELYRVLNFMLGELNGSHLGANPPPDGGNTSLLPSGSIGVDFDRLALESEGLLKVAAVVPQGPADLAGISAGDTLLAVNGATITRDASFAKLMEGQVGRRATLRAGKDAASARDIVLKPITIGQEDALRYRWWVEGTRALVDKLSNGELGYVHLPDMGQSSLESFYFDLDTANRNRKGIVVDVRNNNGGFVNVYAIDVLTRRNYFNMTPRGGLMSTSRDQLGQRAIQLPTILLTNQNTLSDGEDFAEGYRTLKLGKVVGEATAGWIIYTSGMALPDGGFMRMPYIAVADTRGQIMERNPRPADIVVERSPAEAAMGVDTQVERAVKELLAQLKR
jgi:tricorn protease